MKSGKSASVAVVYSNTEEDPYEKLRTVDPATLGFIPEYPLAVATILEEYEAIVNALLAEGFQARLVNVEDNPCRLMQFLQDEAPDAIFNLVEMFYCNPGLESAIASLYELFQIPYTGAGPFALEICRRKALTKLLLLREKVATPNYRLLRTPKIPRRHGLKYPLIVKPAREDASIGVEKESVVYDYDQLMNRTLFMSESHDFPILVEEYISGRELHVSILGNENPQVLPIIEFDFSSLPEEYPAIITYNVKWNPLDFAYHRVHDVCPAPLSKRVEARVRKLALKAYEISGCRDYARIDMRLTESQVPYILEVNPNPDLTESVSFMKSAEQAGLSFSQTLRKIVEFALARG